MIGMSEDSTPDIKDLRDKFRDTEEKKEFPDETTIRIDGEPIHRLKNRLESDTLQELSPLVEGLIFEFLNMEEKANERFSDLQ